MANTLVSQSRISGVMHHPYFVLWKATETKSEGILCSGKCKREESFFGASSNIVMLVKNLKTQLCLNELIVTKVKVKVTLDI